MNGAPWKAMRDATGLSQREVERRLGWKHGHLSWIERGVLPSPEQQAALRAFYRESLLDPVAARQEAAE